MKIDKAKVKKILVIGLSNIGDAVLTTPVVRVLRDNFPQAHLAVLVGPRAFSVFKNDQRLDKKIIYDKTSYWKNKLRLFNRLRQDKYNLVVDLRNSAFAVFLGARYHTSVFRKAPKSLLHMKDRHLWKLKSLGLDIDEGIGPSVAFSENDRQNVQKLLNKWQVKEGRKVIAVAPGARNMTKRWEKEKYRQLVKQLIKEYSAKIIMLGDAQDKLIAEEIIDQLKPLPVNACGKTTIGELAFLLTKCKLLVTNDSAPMHLGWAANIPVVAIFGPSSHKKYAPAGPQTIAIYKALKCYPCEQSLCPKGTRECMKLISVDEVFAACKRILNG